MDSKRERCSVAPFYTSSTNRRPLIKIFLIDIQAKLRQESTLNQLEAHRPQRDIMSASMPHITPSQLPSDRNLTFYDSGFFRKSGNPRTLPTPQKIRDIANASANPNARQRSRPPPVVLEDLGLLVKYGTDITIAEGQCLRILQKLLPGIVPVPEVYGWCEDDGQVFIYMELMSGITLERGWGTMSREDRVGICKQLRRMIEAWRTLKQDPRNPFIGKPEFSHHSKRQSWWGR